MALPPLLDLATLRSLYAGGLSPRDCVAALARRIDDADRAAFITAATLDQMLAQADALLDRAPEPNSLPLWGVPFAVKDNIDVAGFPTTAACTVLDRKVAGDAVVVAKLRAAGAIMVGKTNLDQFATGLNGTRSPYGAPRSVFDPAYISGGSSSGSAVAVAAGLACFALGTDTAGSGRVPAAFNNIVGVKPTPGLLSTTGLVPACRSLDCISIFALSVSDGAEVRRIAEGYDAADPYSRDAAQGTLPANPRVGVLRAHDREFFGDADAAALYQAAIERIGGTIVEIDYAPFRDIAALLYQGPWVAERLAAFEDVDVPIAAVDASVAAIVMGGGRFSAVDAFRGQYELQALKRLADAEWAKIDLMMLPTAPTIYRVDQMLADPIALNSRLGTYTNFFNLLGLSGIAVPAGFRSDGLPFGVTLAAPGFHDAALEPIADHVHRAAGTGSGRERMPLAPAPPAAPPAAERLDIAVVGAHLSGMALHHELEALGARFVAETRTAVDYRLFLLPGATPPKPGLYRKPGFAGPGVTIEIWSLAAADFGRFVAKIPAPLGIGKVAVEGGGEVSCFLCAEAALAGAQEITGFGGWRDYVASLNEAQKIPA